MDGEDDAASLHSGALPVPAADMRDIWGSQLLSWLAQTREQEPFTMLVRDEGLATAALDDVVSPRYAVESISSPGSRL